MSEQARPAGLPVEYQQKLDEVTGLLAKAQRKMAALKGEAEFDDLPDVVAQTLVRKSSAVGHARRDLEELPARVADAQQARAEGEQA